jgi:hypothetical protein
MTKFVGVVGVDGDPHRLASTPPRGSRAMEVPHIHYGHDSQFS